MRSKLSVLFLLLIFLTSPEEILASSPIRTTFYDSCQATLVDDPLWKKLDQFKALMQSLQPELISRMLQQIENEDPFSLIVPRQMRIPEKILKEPRCGIAVKHLRAILEEHGITFKQHLIILPDQYHRSGDHTFLVVELEGHRIILDPTYQQFIYDFIYLPYYSRDSIDTAGYFPQEQILVLPEEHLDLFIQSFVDARNHLLQQWQSAYGILKEPPDKPRVLAMTDARFAAFMKEPWNFMEPRYSIEKD